jgi:type II secretory pathway pseudopilin PulG
MDNMIDPMYYQRLQQYQYQQQLQYQQAIALQQQQQLYLLSQNPGAFFPPTTRVIEESTQPYNGKRHSSGQSYNHKQSRGHHHGKVSNTDLRRRAEMLRNSTESINRIIPSQNTAVYYNTQQPLTPPVMRNGTSNNNNNNGRRLSYNI